jgi:signal transduction histidine kinase
MYRLALCAVVLVALALGVTTARVTQTEPGFALAGPGYAGLAVLLLPGWSLIAVGLVSWWRRQEIRAALSFTAAGAAWFLAEWNSPAAASSVAFTLGLILSATAPAFVAHGVLAYPTGRTGRRETALLLAGDAVAIVGIGLLPAMLADPAAAGCLTCPRDLVAAFDAPDLARDATRLGLLLGAGWALVAAATVIGRVVRSGPLRRARAGVSAAAAAYLVLIAAEWLRPVGSNSLNVDPMQRWLHALQGLALVALAATVAWGWTRLRRTRARVARLVLDLAEAPPPGGLSDVLAASLGDSTLRVGYWLANGGLVDVTGQPVEVSGAATRLVRNGRQVALVTHRPGLLDDPRVVDEVAAAARLAMESEWLQAELRAQLEHLRASRQRIVAAADAARRRLERDLHDGAQQQLVGLLLRLRLHRAGWPTGVDSAVAARAAEVEAELEAAVDDLRELAHGLYPSVLAEEGLAPAVEDFAEAADVPVTLLALPEQRLAAAVESAGYVVVAEAIRRSGACAASVRLQTEAGQLVVDLILSAAVADGGWVTALEDRVGVLEGTLTIRRDDVEDLAVRAVIPCAS